MVNFYLRAALRRCSLFSIRLRGELPSFGGLRERVSLFFLEACSLFSIRLRGELLLFGGLRFWLRSFARISLMARFSLSCLASSILRELRPVTFSAELRLVLEALLRLVALLRLLPLLRFLREAELLFATFAQLLPNRLIPNILLRANII